MTELQERLLKLLMVVDDLCRKHDIDYYLLGGTLIGALRHKGFIPWDDDADVIMTRDNWEKFYRLTKDEIPEGYKISAQDDDINVGVPINRLTETTTTGFFRYHLAAPEIAGTQIDIFVMDPVPDTEEDKQLYRDAITEYSEISVLHAAYQFRNGKNSNFTKNWERYQEVGRGQALKELSEKAFGYSEEESQLYAQRFGGAPHFWPKEVFGKPQYVPFENTYLPIPERPADCLTIGYDDDWRFIPRSGVTLTAHEFAARNYTTPSTVVWDEFEQHVDRDKLMKAFVERKHGWDKQFDSKFNLDLDTQKFLKAKVELKYKKILKDNDVSELLANKDFEALNEIFEEYLKYQSSSRLLGSSSLSGWIQYYRRNNRVLIDIGDEAITVVLNLLLHDQRLALAVKMMDARESIDRPLTEELIAIRDSIHRIRKIISTYGCEEYAECRKLVDEGLALYPENPFYVKHDIFLKEKDGLSGEGLVDEINRGLSIVPDEAGLLAMMAEIHRSEGRSDKEIEIYDFLIENTDDGIILTDIKNRCEEIYAADMTDENYYRMLLSEKACGMDVDMSMFEDVDENIEEDVNENPEEATKSEDSSESDPMAIEFIETEEGETYILDGEYKILTEPMDDIQQTRLKLLCELDEICRRNGLKYYLAGKILWQAYKYKIYLDKNGEIVVFMKPEDAIRFHEIISAGEIEGRVVESMLNNPKFYRVCMRYCDTSTLDMAVARCDSIKYPGIGITIDILRSRESNIASERFKRFLEKGWEARTSVRIVDWKTKLSKSYVDRLCEKHGEEETARKLFLKLTKGNERASSKERFVKIYSKKRQYFPSSIFDTTSDVELEDHSIMTVGDPNDILAIQQKEDWITRRYKKTSRNHFTRVVDSFIPFDEYREYLKEVDIDTADYQARWKKNNWDYKEITQVSRMARDYWYTLAVCCDRYNMYDQYDDQKDVIMEAYGRGDPEEVRELIDDYFRLARRYVRRNLALYFDKDFFEVLVWYMNNSEREGMAQKIQRLQKEQKWAEIKDIKKEKNENDQKM